MTVLHSTHFALRSSTGRTLEVRLHPEHLLITQALCKPGCVVVGVAPPTELQCLDEKVEFVAGTPEAVARATLRLLLD